MLRMAGLVAVAAAATCQVAFGDEIRRTAFADALLGTWALTPELCEAKDKSNVVIAKTGYTNADGDCRVQWIVETAGSLGPNYAVHAACVDAAKQTTTKNMIIRPQSADRISIGTTFEDLKTHQRCTGS